MYSIVQCPECSTKVKVDLNAGKASCPACRRRFSPASQAEEAEGWPISPWAVAAAGCAVVGLLSASLLGIRLLTQLLAVASLVACVLGFTVGKAASVGKSKLWLMLSGGGGAFLLLATLLFPGLLNHKWAIDVAVNKPSADLQTVMPRDDPLEGTRKTLGAEDWIDAANEVVRQKDLLLSLESFKIGPMADKGTTEFAQVHLRFTNMGGGIITFSGFEETPPVLQDVAGAACSFLEQHKRAPVQNLSYPVFGVAKMEGATVQPLQKEEFLLVFTKPSGGSKNLKLTIPAKAWGLKGEFRFQIADTFDATP